VRGASGGALLNVAAAAGGAVIAVGAEIGPGCGLAVAC